MSYFSNVNEHGGLFLDILNNEFQNATNVEIATGYIGASIVETFNDQFLRIAEYGGTSKLLVGMAFYEGFSGGQENMLKELNQSLTSAGQENGVYISISGRYHGKIYKFNNSRYYVGSSNFSLSGLNTNKEFNLLVSDENHREKIQSYLNYLFSSANAAKIDQVDIVSKKYKRKQIGNNYSELMNELERYDPNSINVENLVLAFSFPLEHSAKQEKSHLNKYFAKGRKGSNGITPRPWYEVELITPAAIIQSAHYPKGDFMAYTNDGYIIPMHTSGANNKNIESKGGLQFFGAWLKGKLENSGALERAQLFDLDVLIAYGKSELKFYKMQDSNSSNTPKYYLEF